MTTIRNRPPAGPAKDTRETTSARPTPRSERGLLPHLSQEQLAFLVRPDVVGPLTPVQRQILGERATYEDNRRCPDVLPLEGRQSWVPCSEDTKREAEAQGAKTWRQVLDFAYYGTFLPDALEERWDAVFP